MLFVFLIIIIIIILIIILFSLIKKKFLFYICFQYIPLDCFEGQSSDGRRVPVVPGGYQIPLHFHNRCEYAEKVLQYRLHEMDKQVIIERTVLRIVEQSLKCV